MRKLGDEDTVSAVMSMYTGAKTVVRTVSGNSKGFEVKVGMHHCSGLSPLLFVIDMNNTSREFRVALPWELLYADDLAVIAETEEELIKRLNEWKDNVESKSMRVSMNNVVQSSCFSRRYRSFKFPTGWRIPIPTKWKQNICGQPAQYVRPVL